MQLRYQNIYLLSVPLKFPGFCIFEQPMNRKEFFRKLLFGGVGVVLPKSIEKLSPPPPQKIRLATVFLAGLSFYDGPEALSLLEPQMPLQLSREPHNLHDKNAVQVFSGEAKLGYIPRSENKTIARLMDEGKPVEAVILEVNPEEFPAGGIKAEVFYYM